MVFPSGWGTHEKTFPVDGRRHPGGCQAAIYLDRPGALTKVRSWTPKAGPFHGWLITHTEAISIADYFTKFNGDKVSYRPTVHFAYHPSADAVMSMHEVSSFLIYTFRTIQSIAWYFAIGLIF
jgi:homospermidine synthase